MDAIEAISARFSLAAKIAVIATSAGVLPSTPLVSWVSAGTSEARRYAIFGEIVVVLDRDVQPQNSDIRKKFICLTDFDTFVGRGLPCADFTGRQGSAREIVSGLVYGADRTYSTVTGMGEIAFDHASTLRDALPALASMIEEAIDTRLPPRPLLILCGDQSKLMSLPRRFLDGLNEGIKRAEIDVLLAATEHGIPDRELAKLVPNSNYCSTRLLDDQVGPGDLRGWSALVVADMGEANKYSDAALIDGVLLPAMVEMLDDTWHEGNVGDAVRNLVSDPSKYIRDRHRLAASGQIDETTVAVIVPHYNTEFNKLTRAIASALELREHHPLVEVVVVDDGSDNDDSRILEEHFGRDWGNVKYVRRENGGLGPARNTGVSSCSSDFVWFLDSDDELVPSSLRALLECAVARQADAVIGKRLLVNSEGEFLSDSLDYLFRSVFRQVEVGDVDIIDDHMANNKLVRRSAILKYDLWFPEGKFEDNEWTARLYSSGARVAMLNLPTHLWYQYGPGESITKHFDAGTVREKITSLDRSWVYLSHSQRSRRVQGNASGDLRHYLVGAEADPKERLKLLVEGMSYFSRRVRYFPATTNSASMLQFLRSETGRLLSGQGSSGSGSENSEDELGHGRARVVFFPRTLFHVLSMLMYKLEYGGEVVVALDSSGSQLPKPVVKALRGSKLVESVWSVSTPGMFNTLTTVLATQGSSSVSALLCALFRSYDKALGGRVDPDDTAAIFLSDLPEQYYVERAFSKFIKFEDGRGSIKRETEIGSGFGVWGKIWNAIERHDELSLRRKVVPSEAYLNSPLTVLPLLSKPLEAQRVAEFPFDQLLWKHRDALLEFLRSAFGPVPEVEAGGTVILTQPLYRNYCSVEEHLALVGHMVMLAGDSAILKPHPADECDYSALGIPVLPRDIPFEYLDLEGCSFDSAISFGSSTAGSTEVHRRLFKLDGFTPGDVRAAIQRMVWDEGAIDCSASRLLIVSNGGRNIGKGRPANLRAMLLRARSLAGSAVKLARSDPEGFRVRASQRLSKLMS